MHKLRRNAKNTLRYSAGYRRDSDAAVFAVPVCVCKYVRDTDVLPRT